MYGDVTRLKMRNLANKVKQKQFTMKVATKKKKKKGDISTESMYLCVRVNTLLSVNISIALMQGKVHVIDYAREMKPLWSNVFFLSFFFFVLLEH